MLRSTSLIITLGLLFSMKALAADTPAEAGPPATQPADAVAKPVAVPVALVEHPVCDFGTVWAGNLSHKFTMRNVGTEPLNILSVKPASAAYAQVGTYPKVIPPGESGEFPVTLMGERLRGTETTVAVMTNDPAHSQTTLTLKALVKQFVTVEPANVSFGRLEYDELATRKVTLTNNTDKPFKPTIKERANPSAAFKYELTEIEPGKLYELTVNAAPPYQPSYNRDILLIDPGMPGADNLKVMCYAVLPKRLELSAERISIPENDTVKQRTITLTNNGATPVKLIEATAEDESLTVNTKELTAGKQYEITIVLPEKYKPPANGTAVVLRLDDAQQPELKIPIMGEPARKLRSAEKLLGKPAPSLTLKTYDDKEVKTGKAAGKVQVLTIWASWCPYCRKAMPEIEKISKQFSGKPVDFLTINTDSRSGSRAQTREQTLEAYNNLKLTMPMVMNAEIETELQSEFSMFSTDPNYIGTGVPTFFLVGKDGTVEAVHVGYRTEVNDTLIKEIEQLLEGKKLAEPGS